MAVGDTLDARELLVRDVGAGALALDGEDAVGGFVTGPLLAGDGGNDGAGGNDLVGFEVLGFGDLFGGDRIAFGVDNEEVCGVFFCDDTTGEGE